MCCKCTGNLLHFTENMYHFPVSNQERGFLRGCCLSRPRIIELWTFSKIDTRFIGQNVLLGFPLTSSLAEPLIEIYNSGYSLLDESEILSQTLYSPGAQESTRAPMLVPSFQSVVKFLMGRSGILFCTHSSSLCFGVRSLSIRSSSPSHMGIEME